ncbi:MAG: hypothetical protein D8M25_02305 [Bacteroidetes bacterium]|nr:hypothetical protein [Bacteroidota bacterium]
MWRIPRFGRGDLFCGEYHALGVVTSFVENTTLWAWWPLLWRIPRFGRGDLFCGEYHALGVVTSFVENTTLWAW